MALKVIADEQRARIDKIKQRLRLASEAEAARRVRGLVDDDSAWQRALKRAERLAERQGD